jgi:hypothetical protein
LPPQPQVSHYPLALTLIQLIELARSIDARYFWVLAVISSCMVGSAFLIFTFTRPDLYPPASEEPEYEKVSVEMA